MNLDLTRPTLVLTGVWNPAIFQVPWMAVNLFGKKRGDSFGIVEVQIPGRQPVRYFEDIGIGVTRSRVELFTNAFAQENKNALENLAVNIIGLLPHTPMNGFGVNFIFEIPDPDEGLIDKLKTQDRIEASFKIEQQVFTAVIRMDGVRLTWRREKSPQRVGLDFNFHHQVQGSGEIRPLIAGCIEKYYTRAVELVSQVYGEQDTTVGGHMFPAELQQMGEANVG